MYKLYNGDCLEKINLVKDKSIDLAIIDPPYIVHAGKGAGAFGNRNNLSEINFMSNGFDLEILNKIEQKMKKINIYIYCSKKQVPILLEYAINKKLNYDILTFNKTNPTPLCNNKYLSDTEYIIFLRERGVKIFGNYHTKFTYYIDKVNTEDKKKYKHPTIKPLELIKRHIINSSNEGDTILDCFMGSGTTGVACMNTNRKFIGIELDKNYFDIASKRIEEAFFNAQNKEGAINEE